MIHFSRAWPTTARSVSYGPLNRKDTFDFFELKLLFPHVSFLTMRGRLCVVLCDLPRAVLTVYPSRLSKTMCFVVQTAALSLIHTVPLLPLFRQTFCGQADLQSNLGYGHAWFSMKCP